MRPTIYQRPSSLGDLVAPQSSSAWARFVTRRPWLVIACGLALGAVLAAQLPKLTFNMATENWVAEDDPARVDYYDFQRHFGRTDTIALAIRLPDTPADPAFLAKLMTLQRDLERSVPYIRRTSSLIDARHSEARGDELHIGDLIEALPNGAAEVRALELEIAGNPLYENLVISPDHQWTLLSLQTDLYVSESDGDAFAFDTAPASTSSAASAASAGGRARPALRKLAAAEDHEILSAVEAVVAEHDAAGFEIRMAGSIPLQVVIETSLQRGLGELLLLAFMMIALLLGALFRSATTVLLILTVVGLALVGTIGFMALCGIPISMGTQLLPCFLLAVGVGYSVHVVTRFRQGLDAGDRKHAARCAIEHTLRPIAMTALTTIGGLISFIPAELVPISDIGLFAPAGVALAAFYSLTLLPALLVVLPPTLPEARFEVGWTQRAMVRLGLWSAEHRGSVFAALAITIAISTVGMLRLFSSHHPLEEIRNAPAIVETSHIIDESLGGASMIELLIETRDGVTLRDPALLQRMDAAETRILGMSQGPVRAGKVIGLHQAVKEINRVLHDDAPEAYVVPDDPRLVAQELMLFESSGSDDVEQLVDSGFRVGRLNVRVNNEDAYLTAPYIEAVLAAAREEIGELASVRLAGTPALMMRTFVAVNDSMVRSYLIAFVVVSLMLVPMIGHLRIGLLAIIPNITPIIVALGFMGWVGIPVSTMTLLVGSIALGLAVDDTIHFSHGFLRHLADGADPRRAVALTMRSTGIALLFTSVTLVCGFLTYGFGALSLMVHFGVVAALAIAVALLADVTVLPAMLTWASEDAASSRSSDEPTPLRSRAERVRPNFARDAAA